jgi:hypothetical protein
VLLRPAAFVLSLLCAAGIHAAAADARAEDSFDIGVTVGPRLTHFPAISTTYANPLTGYGYGPMTVYVDGSIAPTYRVARHLDAGLRFSWLYGTAGSTGADGKSMSLNALEMMPVLRLLWRGKSRRAGLGLELGGGVQIPQISLRDQTITRANFVLEPAFVAWMAPSFIQPMMRVAPSFSHMHNALGGKDLSTGGITVSFGINASL